MNAKCWFVGMTICGFIAGCSGGNGSEDKRNCQGYVLTAPDKQVGDFDFTINELMAHSAAMGMTQQEAETLLYLEGIPVTHRLSPGETLCIDGRPD